ncbi:hypothetical protein Tco_0505760 [Tanacetum coccineum]
MGGCGIASVAIEGVRGVRSCPSRSIVESVGEWPLIPSLSSEPLIHEHVPSTIDNTRVCQHGISGVRGVRFSLLEAYMWVRD